MTEKVQQHKLDAEVAETRRTIAADGYPMSIGELTNLYRDKELIIRPEFQRLFRWSALQKSRLVESLLLGIPLPSIFVSQQAEGKWELVDGLQRVSTILQLQGELLNENAEPVEPLVLEKTKFLPALEGKRWNGATPQESLSPALKLDIKRSKIDVKIIKRESSPETKYDLFQRLNSYGSIATPQELRSALLVAVSSGFFRWIEGLASYPSFVGTTSISEGLRDQRYDLELVLRFLVLHNRPQSELTQATLRNFTQYLDDQSVALATAHPDGDEKLGRTFMATFDAIAEHGGEDVFRRWDLKRQRFQGSFLNTPFEVFGLGVGYYVAQGKPFRTNLLDLARQFWARPEISEGFATGRSTEARLAQFIPLGREILKSRARPGARKAGTKRK